MTATCSSVAIIKHDFFFFMSETSANDAVYTLMIQSVLEYEIVLSLMVYTATLIMRSSGGALQSISSYQGSKEVIKNISPLIGYSSGTRSPDSIGSYEISSAKTSDFLDFAKMKSKLNSWRMTIHLLILPPITRCVNMY